MHNAIIKFYCQFCGKKLSANDSLVGRSRPCPNCSSRVTVPTQLPVVKQSVDIVSKRPVAPPSQSPSRTLSQSQGFGMAMAPPQADSEMIPIEMRMPCNLGGMKAQVDKKTGGTLVSVFTGGVMVVIGAFLVTMLGGKVRSA